MDTELAYIPISGESVESSIKPEITVEIETDMAKWFP